MGLSELNIGLLIFKNKKMKKYSLSLIFMNIISSIAALKFFE